MIFSLLSKLKAQTNENAATYEKAGVNIAAGEELVKRIQSTNKNIGGFAGLYKLDEQRSLVACTDGVGTKLELSIALERYEDLGQDLVAMSVNDLVVCGARPLFFLDYFATGKLNVDVAHRVIKGIERACTATGCILLGGETAEMPGFYEGGKFDLAGFAVGEVLNHKIIDGKKVTAGDVIVGLPSSGFHANGYSLVRKILKDHQLSLATPFESQTIGHYLTEPTRLYVSDARKAMDTLEIKAMAHITGGGLTNINRVLPAGLHHRINHEAIPTPAIMREFVKLGGISQDEAYTVWNMGLGFVMVVSKEDAPLLLKTIPGSFEVGKIHS
jgi:phosphoribosylformylglycinamidine cyclo-ligase